MIVSLRKPPQGGSVAHDAQHDPSMVLKLRHVAPQRAPVAEPQQVAPQVHREARAITPARPVKKRRRVPGFVILIGLALFLALGSGLYFTLAAHSSAPAQLSKAASADLVAHIGKLILLPQGEEPTIATVTDLSALSGQAFFKNAALGDKVLMYPKAQEAVLYDPAQDKVIQVAPLSVTGQ